MVYEISEDSFLLGKYAEKFSRGKVLDVGTGNGYSNRQVIKMIEEVSGKKINLIERERRKGDADRLIADPVKIKTELGFEPKYSDLETIIRTAWQWHSKNIKY